MYPGRHVVPEILKNFQQEVEDYYPTTRARREAEEEDVVIPYVDEPLASQEFMQEYNRKRVMEEELRQKLQQRVDGVVPWESS